MLEPQFSSMVEGIVKAVAMLRTTFKKQPKEIILTGRLSRIDRLFGDLEKVLSEKFSVTVRHPTHGFAKEAKGVAQGTALLANGIAGGKYVDLVESMKIKEAKGTVLDYIFFPRFDKRIVLKNLRMR